MIFSCRKRLLFLLALVVLLGIASAGASVPAFVQHVSNGSATTGTTISVNITGTAGNLWVAYCIDTNNPATLSVADGGSDTFTPITTANSTAAVFEEAAFFVQSIAGGIKTVTCTSTLSSGFRSIFIYEYSGQAASALDVSGTSSDNVGGISGTPSVTLTTAANTVTTSALTSNLNASGSGTCTPNACTNFLSDSFGNGAEDESNGGGGATKVVFLQPTPTNYCMIAVSFKGKASTAGCSLPLLGAGPC